MRQKLHHPGDSGKETGSSQTTDCKPVSELFSLQGMERERKRTKWNKKGLPHSTTSLLQLIYHSPQVQRNFSRKYLHHNTFSLITKFTLKYVVRQRNIPVHTHVALYMHVSNKVKGLLPPALTKNITNRIPQVCKIYTPSWILTWRCNETARSRKLEPQRKT